MHNKSLLKGVFLVGIGAASYGMLATFVKLAYLEGYTTAEITTSQFVYGLLGVWLVVAFQNIKNGSNTVVVHTTDRLKLLLAGTSLGMTSVFYYLCVKYINVSIAIILLMQTVWIGVLVEMIVEKKRPSNQKIAAVVLVLIGTVLATNVLNHSIALDWRGLFWGLLSALSFSTTMFTANRIANHLPSAKRSLYMLVGGGIVILFFLIITQNTPFNYTIFTKWGILLALFGTIIPPLLMNVGFPLTGIGLGSIVAALELPVSVLMAYFLLHENVFLLQWIGILLIIVAIIGMNINLKK
ncbi:EamA family transporter [Flavobacterium branchiophilum]|uniref:Threonine/homoserine efflux transporter RhtA n=1 Tax=Flavobacterium branchiophilum TaxID=55197 RepID=A0A543G6J8_9FLAO|nr:DMT family transporter [Flavobacterium branchiophilum]OXA75627.1 EamA family transporter [Flavobacterium branchiophilum] [Flavobacterium branchiophilum NBRC 15030 = ATCC 35035]TQM41713.1 threonine/homoserine efflux transporter RhtA [Flavobacterium branchiophilum]GEM55459.1 permease [Flavobacterium branchiophilum NBRC 15030 = ATCC 35035]